VTTTPSSRPKAPLPGTRVRGSASGRPIMALLDLLGRRGTLRLLWELRDGQPQNFRTLQQSMGGASPTLLNSRAKELREAQLLELRPDGYALTARGLGLLDELGPLDRWAQNWARALSR